MPKPIWGRYSRWASGETEISDTVRLGPSRTALRWKTNCRHGCVRISTWKSSLLRATVRSMDQPDGPASKFPKSGPNQPLNPASKPPQHSLNAASRIRMPHLNS